MFELDYLTQRLTFTAAPTSRRHDLIDGYAPTFAGDMVELPVEPAEPLAAELDAFLAVVRAGGRPVVDGEEACGRVRHRQRPARVGRASGAPSTSRTCPAGSRPMTITQPTIGRDSSSWAGRSRSGQPLPHAPARPSRPGPASRARLARSPSSGAGKMGLPLARPVRRARLARHRGRRQPGRGGRDQRRRAPRRRGAGARRARRARPRGGPPAARRSTRAAAAARGRRRRAHRAGDARRRAASRTTGTWTRRSRRSRRASTQGSLVIFETTLPVGDTRDRFAPRAGGASGLRSRTTGLLRRVLARSACTRGAVLAQPRDVPQARRRRRPRVEPSGPRVLRVASSIAEVVAMSNGRGGRVQQARRHHLPRRQHRPGQRVRPATPTRIGRRHPGGHRGGEQPALQPHPPAGHRRRRALHPGLPALPALAGARRWSSSSRPARSNEDQVGRAVKTHPDGRSAGSRACRSSCSG